jgi:hypothetical protein
MLCVVLVSLIACATSSTTFTGRSYASGKLRTETVQRVSAYLQQHGQCGRIDSVSISSISGDLVVLANQGPGVYPHGIIKERWTIMGCGATASLAIVYTSDDKARNQISIASDP